MKASILKAGNEEYAFYKLNFSPVVVEEKNELLEKIHRDIQDRRF